MSKSLLKLVFLLISCILVFGQENSLQTFDGKKEHFSTVKKDNPDNSLPENSKSYSEKKTRLDVIKNIIIVVLILALIGLYFYYNFQQKKRFLKFKNIIKNQQKVRLSFNEIEQNSIFSNISVIEMDDDNEEVNKKRNESLMTSETETKLLELLEEFEKGNLYNNKNMSLPFLAGELGTNTKYLSYVINQHKSADFKSYINRLRIDYIVRKLANDEKYRQYKISILAEECGFSSHSKFASIFKAVTEFSPSAFIKHLEEEDRQIEPVHFPENT